MVVLYDQKKKKMTFYSSSKSFTLEEAIEAKLQVRQPEYLPNYESFTNADYETLCTQDFRRVRYRKAEIYGGDSESEDDAPVLEPPTIKKRVEKQAEKSNT